MARRVDLTLLHAAISARRSFGMVATYPSGCVAMQLRDLKSFDQRGERGTVNGFSAMSRRRLMERVIRLDWTEQQAYFITLTYPAVYTRNPREWKANLHAFKQWLWRQSTVPDPWCLWRLEFQRRGAPHYHLVACLVVGTDLSVLRDRIRVEWSRLVGLSATPGHFARVDVQEVRLQGDAGTQRLLTYLCKYVGKRQKARHPVDPETGEISNTGRMWGSWGPVPYAASVSITISATDYIQYCRRVRRWAKRNPFLSHASVAQKSFLVYAPAEVSRQLLRGLGEPDPSNGKHARTDGPGDNRAIEIECSIEHVNEM